MRNSSRGGDADGDDARRDSSHRERAGLVSESVRATWLQATDSNLTKLGGKRI